jgi:hypothetical protein
MTEGRTMTENEKEKLIREYAAGEIAWSTMRERGIESYADVLAGLGKLGLRPPVAPLDGPNREARELGRAVIREALKATR